MEGKTHAYIGIATISTIALTNFPTLDLGFVTVFPLIGLPAAVGGALMADIDKRETTMGSKHKLISGMFKTHRGITHTPLVCVGLFLLLLLFQGDSFILQVIASILFGFVAGYWSHVFVDSFNRRGIPHLWPLIWKRMHMMSVVTGSFEEKVFLVIFVALCVVQVVCTYFHITV